MIHTALSHPKTKLLQKRLGLPLFQVVGVLESLWLMTSQYYDDGNLDRITPSQIAAYMDWQDDPLVLVDALVECGWLDRDGDSLRVHDWEEHCPKYVRDRRAKRNARKRSSAADSTSAHPQNVAECRRQSTTSSDTARTVADTARTVADTARTVAEHRGKSRPNLNLDLNLDQKEGRKEGFFDSLKSRGVTQADKAVESARQLGKSDDDIAGLLMHFDSQQSNDPAPGPGLLYAWMTGSKPWPIGKPPKKSRSKAKPTPKRHEVPKSSAPPQTWVKSLEERKKMLDDAGVPADIDYSKFGAD